MLHHVPTIELQDRLFAEVARVLRPGAALVASDSLASDELEAHHEGDTYNPVDPSTLPARLEAAGFTDVDVRTNDVRLGRSIATCRRMLRGWVGPRCRHGPPARCPADT